MYSFKNDYSEGAHPRILEALVNTNTVQQEGYTMDSYTAEAKALLKKKIGREDLSIHLFPGGTQTNLTALSAFMRPHEAAVSAESGHILVHETGAIEATGHKVISMSSDDGKLTPQLIQAALDGHPDEHMVKPRLVYLSNSTEVGSIYTLAELKAIHTLCQAENLLLYIDGARLGSALTSDANDLTLSDLAKYSDAFYIGATKNGALLGEALIIVNDTLKADFRYLIKQRGALLAKGRLLGIQFRELFKDDLYFELAAHANAMAKKLSRGISELGYEFLSDSPSNQIFPILPAGVIKELEKNYAFYIWQPIDEKNSAIRLITSWATTEEAIDAFLLDLKHLTR